MCVFYWRVRFYSGWGKYEKWLLLVCQLGKRNKRRGVRWGWLRGQARHATLGWELGEGGPRPRAGGDGGAGQRELFAGRCGNICSVPTRWSVPTRCEKVEARQLGGCRASGELANQVGRLHNRNCW